MKNLCRTRHVHCQKEECDDFIVLHLGFLDYTHYILTVHLYGLENFHQRYNIKEVYFYVRFLVLFVGISF